MDRHLPAWLLKKLLQRPAYEADIVCNLLRSGGYLRIYFISFFLDSGSFLSSFFINRCFGVAEEEWNKMFFVRMTQKLSFCWKCEKFYFCFPRLWDKWNFLLRKFQLRSGNLLYVILFVAVIGVIFNNNDKNACSISTHWNLSSLVEPFNQIITAGGKLNP